MRKIPQTNPRSKSDKNLAIVEDIEVAVAVKVVRHGGRFYLSVRPRDVSFWGLAPGDIVLMKLTKVKRLVSQPLSDFEE